MRTLNEPARVGLLARELRNVGVNVAAIQEIRWPRTGEREFRAVDPIANTSFKYHIYYSGGDRAERGVGFIVIGKQMKRIIRWKPVSDRICVLRMKGKFFNYSLISIYAPTNDKPDDMKDEFYESLDKAYGECPKQDVKIVIGDANAQIGKEDFFRPVIGTESLHSVTNDNGLRLVTFAAARGMAISSTYFARKNIRKHTWRHPSGDACSQIDHVLVDGRHFSDVIDVRTFRGPNIDSDHYLVVAKIRARLSSVTSSTTNRTLRFNIQRLSTDGVAAQYRQQLDEKLGRVNVAGDVDSLWDPIHEAVTTTAREVIGTGQRRRRNDWFDEECQRVTDMKNVARSRMLVAGTRQNRERYRAARAEEKRIHRRKKRQHEESVVAEAQESMNRNDMRRFYATVNGARHNTVPVPAMCNDREGNLLTDKTAVAARWKEHFQQLLNGENGNVARNRMNIDDDDQAVDPPTIGEVKRLSAS